MSAGNGQLARRPRAVLSQDQFELRGMTFRFVCERIAPAAEWKFDESHHVFVVHRSGQLRATRLECDGAPRADVGFRGGDVWVIPAQRRCAAMVHGDSVEFVEIVVPEKVLGDTTLRQGLGVNDPFLREVVNRLHGTFGRTDPSTRLLRESLAEAARLHIRDRYSRPRGGQGPVPRRFTARTRNLIVEYLESELASDISLEQLADLCDMPVAPFVAGFNAAFGTTPYQYVLDRRIETAQKLLTTTGKPIRVVGAEVGFSTASHFASTFRQRVGVTPSEYRAEALR